MSGDPFTPLESEIRRDFSSDVVTRSQSTSGRVRFLITNVQTPDGCSPRTIRVLLVYSSPSEAPLVLVDPLPTLSNGSPTPNPRPTQVDGEVWQDYSVRWSWEAGESIWMNVRRKLMRFASTQ